MGRDIDGKVQPMTLVFFVNNVNYAQFLNEVREKTNGDPDPYFVSLVKKAKTDGAFKIPIVRPGSTDLYPGLAGHMICRAVRFLLMALML